MAPYSLLDRLLRRETGEDPAYSSIRGLYGDRKWVRDLDVTNELAGHNGCVNALSWSKNGSLLASGSDDTFLNIHSYLPQDDVNPFRFTTSISTGHTANIFSVKFMPHSNDATLITAAGDGEIRIFDLEYTARSSAAAENNGDGGSYRRGVARMSTGDTNAKVFRSHSDRVKRIVTESSPHLFLSCSEDGEVRQWDLRQPSSAYPRPGGHMRGWAQLEDDPDVPPPLITYKRHHIDINTISCSASQPHYIVLGGAHLHAFLHDRRMMGRDQSFERGSPGGAAQVREATQCVRRFAPKGQKRMKPGDNGHITACKISDAHPNTMIASWSGDHIYSFDLVRDPDAEDPDARFSPGLTSRRTRPRFLQRPIRRKRRRRAAESEASPELSTRAGQRQRTSQDGVAGEEDDQYLAINYGNGQSEMIPIRDESEIREAQAKARKIARATLKLKRCIFKIGKVRQDRMFQVGFDFYPVYKLASLTLYDIDHVIRTWRYPVDPPDSMLAHMELRKVRDATRRFVQATGFVASALGASAPAHPDFGQTDQFVTMTKGPNETELDPDEDAHTIFRLDFLKAVGLWVGSGPSALVSGFTARRSSKNSARNPIPPDSSIDALSDILIPWLHDRAGVTEGVPDVDSSRFEVDENRHVFKTERDAVLAFGEAVQRPFEDLAWRTGEQANFRLMQNNPNQSRIEALKFWGLKVARGLLQSADLAPSFALIDQAFGGTGETPDDVEALEAGADEVSLHSEDHDFIDANTGTLHARVDGTEHELPVDEDGQVDTRALPDLSEDGGNQNDDAQPNDDAEEQTPSSPLDVPGWGVWHHASDYQQNFYDPPDDDEDYDEDDSDDNDDDEGDDEDDENEESNDSDFVEDRHRFFAGAIERGAARSTVQQHVPCHSPLRSYRGHANVRTVKDVNFYGLNDEYIISGSDSGHFMIWDAYTTKLVNILDGDSSVVNVVQGHPYEPMIAVSGIDNTIKIFGCDTRARRDAWLGRGVENDDERESFSSTVHFGGRTRLMRPERDTNRAMLEQLGGMIAQPVDNMSSEESAWDDEHEHDMDEDSDSSEGDSASDADGRRRGPTAFDDAAVCRGMRPGVRIISKRRFHERTEIVRRNRDEQRGGRHDAVLTRGMLAQLAMRLRMRGAAPGAAAGAGTGAGAAAGGGGARRAGNAGAGAAVGEGDDGDGDQDDEAEELDALGEIELPDGRVVTAEDCLTM